MRRLLVLLAATLVLALGGLTLAVAQDATPETNVLGTPCPSPAASPVGPLAGTPLPSPALAPEALASPFATPMASPATLAGCPTPGAGTPGVT